MTPEQLGNLVAQGGAVAVLIAVFAAAVRGDIRFRPGVDGERDAKDDALAHERAGRERAEAHAAKLADAVDKLGDALEARNRRDERMRRGT